MLVAEQPLGGEQRRVLGEVLAVHDQVLPVHVHLDVVVPALARACGSRAASCRCSASGSSSPAPSSCARARAAGPCSPSVPATCAEAVDEPAPAVRVRRLERVVVALDPGPDDHRHAQLARQLRAGDGDLHRLAADGRVGIDEPAAAEARIEVQPAGEAVDVVVRTRAPRGSRPRSPRSAPAGSGTRSRRSGRRARRPPAAPARPSSRRARSGW